MDPETTLNAKAPRALEDILNEFGTKTMYFGCSMLDSEETFMSRQNVI